jgi:RNA polymerase sigma factor (sigma-70 family)
VSPRGFGNRRNEENALTLTKEELDELLDWLDPNPGRAGDRYEAIRQGLITVFLNRQCEEVEDLADETINRVARRARELKATYVGKPELYFYGVAKNVMHEYYRKRNRVIQPPPSPPSLEDLEPYLACLDECLAKLPRENSDLILLYYKDQKKGKIASHRQIGVRLRLKAGALRARVFRIRVRLEKCIRECLKRSNESDDIKPFSI